MGGNVGNYIEANHWAVGMAYRYLHANEVFQGSAYQPQFQEGGTNAVKYCNPAMDALIDQAEQLYRPEDADRRLALYQEVERMMLADVPIVPLYTLNLVRLRSPRFQGHYLHPLWREDWESYWTNPQ